MAPYHNASTMAYEKDSSITPRIIIHGGAGNITRENLPEKPYNTHRSALLAILHDANYSLRMPNATALDVATYAVTQLENNGLFNSGHGAVYTIEGKHELEASVMVSRGYRKRGVGVMGVKRVRNPILLAREMLIRGEEDNGGGAHGHQQLHGETCDRLAEEWGLDLVQPSYFWTRRRWDEHRRGLGLSHDKETYHKEKRKADEGAGGMETFSHPPPYSADGSHVYPDNSEWDGHEYLPRGTVGAVVMDSTGTICVATSTGGITNKLPGRIGDTPTMGAGFWAEEFRGVGSSSAKQTLRLPERPDSQSSSWLGGCLNRLHAKIERTMVLALVPPPFTVAEQGRRAVAVGGTGNGDSFLKVDAARTAAAIARYATRIKDGKIYLPSLQDAVTHVAGTDGVLQKSAEDRWHKTGEGDGGMIGIEFDDGQGHIVFDYNCGGMFHAWFDDNGKAKFQVFKDRVDEG